LQNAEKANRDNNHIFDNTVFILWKSMIEEIIQWRRTRELRKHILSYRRKEYVKRERNQVFTTSSLAEKSALSNEQHKH